MKKFFSMFCALAIILSVNAAPKKVAFNPEKVKAEKEMVVKQNTLVGAVPAAKKAVPGLMRSAKKVNEVVVIDMTAAPTTSFNDYTTVAGEEWFQMRAQDADYVFSLCVNTDHLIGTFTPAEFDMDYTYLYAYSAADEDFVKISLASAITATVSGNETDGYTFYAELNGADGNEYHITMYYYEAPFVPTGDTVEVVITEPMTYSYIKSDGDWYLRGANADYSVALDLVNNDSVSPAGTYTADDVLASYTNVTVKATSTKLTMEDFSAVVTDANNRYDVEAYMLCSDGNVYHITMFYAIPEALYFDTIVATNLDIEEETVWFWTVYAATASNAAYSVELSFDADTTGVYEASGSITPLNGTATKIYSGNVNLTNTNGDYTITGSVLCQNNTEYTLDLSFVMPTKTREEVFMAPDAMFNDYTATDSLWQMRGYNVDSTQFMSVTLYSDVIGGNYTRANMYKAYCAVYDLIGDSVVNKYKFVDLDLSVQVDENGNVTVAGTVLAQNIANTADVPEFTVQMTYLKPQATREVTVTIDAEVNDLTESNGVWQIRGFNAAGDLYVSVAAYADQLAGTYTTSMLYTDYTVAVTIVGADTTYFDAVDADFTVTVDASNNVVLAGDILFQNEANRADVPLFHLTMNSVLKTGLQYDEENADFSENFPVYEVNDKYFESDGMLIVDADNNNDATIDLLFFVGEDGLVDGTYPVNSSEQPGTVWACTGVDSEGYIDFGFAGYLNAQNQITQVWFIVEGNVTVQGGRITVHALNSYGRSIDAVLNSRTGIEDVKADDNNNAEKFMRNGNLIIRRNGVEYNAQGATL